MASKSGYLCLSRKSSALTPYAARVGEGEPGSRAATTTGDATWASSLVGCGICFALGLYEVGSE
jgi:hypothetical protein